MIFYGVSVASMLCALTPAVLFVINLRRYKAPELDGTSKPRGISVLIPARDEAHGIEAALSSALTSTGVTSK